MRGKQQMLPAAAGMMHARCWEAMLIRLKPKMAAVTWVNVENIEPGCGAGRHAN